MTTFEATLFGLVIGLTTAMGIIGCATKRTPKALQDAQHYLHEQHKAEQDTYRKDGRLPPK